MRSLISSCNSALACVSFRVRSLTVLQGVDLLRQLLRHLPLGGQDVGQLANFDVVERLLQNQQTACHSLSIGTALCTVRWASIESRS
ncbi:MAG TPA: hypothetical protein VEZ89_16730, partial [Rubrivivax sp.]|nr:hypothetical protein [Rubrivivax sp.]